MRQRWIRLKRFFKARLPKGKIILDEPDNIDLILHYMYQFDWLEADGEWKAHQVYAKLLKKLPNVSKSKLRLDMELVYYKYFDGHQHEFMKHHE